MSDYRGRFLWIELMTTDVDAAKAFYTEAIGWGTQAWGDGEPTPEMGGQPYTMWTAGGVPVGGLLPLPEEARSMGAPPHWMASIGTPDVDASVKMVKEMGGQVYMPPMDVPKVGRVAVVADPQGAAFGLYQPIEAPSTPLAEPKMGERTWSELQAGNWQDAWKFYEQLFGWTKGEAMDMGGPMGVYQLFGLGTHMQGAMFTKPADMPAPPHWLYYFRVPDVNAAIERIKAAGGKVLNGPMPVPGGIIAQCMDPQGAAFAVHMLDQ